MSVSGAGTHQGGEWGREVRYSKSRRQRSRARGGGEEAAKRSNGDVRNARASACALCTVSRHSPLRSGALTARPLARSLCSALSYDPKNLPFCSVARALRASLKSIAERSQMGVYIYAPMQSCNVPPIPALRLISNHPCRIEIPYEMLTEL